jgi:site-specific recombinase XerD
VTTAANPEAANPEAVDLISNATTDTDTIEWTWEKTVAAWLMGHRSKHTIKAYRGDIILWTRYCANIGVDPLTARRVHIDAFVQEMTGGYAPSTIARRIAALSSLYGYAAQERILEHNIAGHVRRPKVPEISNTRFLNNAEVQAFITTAAQHSTRDLAVTLLLALSGLRSEEIRTLRIEEIGSVDGLMTLWVYGKGGEGSQIPVPNTTAEVIDKLVGHRSSGYIISGGKWRGWGTHEQLPATLNNYDEVDMSANQLGRMVTRLANRAGINNSPLKVTPHSFRHSAITIALSAGVTMRDAEVFARHSDPKTTRRYDRQRNDFSRHASLVLERKLIDGLDLSGTPETDLDDID